MRKLLYRTLLIIGIGMQSLLGVSQETGLPYYSDIAIPEELGEPRITFISQLHDRSMLFGSSSGLLIYDGTSWEVVTTEDVPNTAFIDELEERVFIGLNNSIVELVEADTAAYALIPVVPLNESISEVRQIFRAGDQLIFRSDQGLWRHNLREGKTEQFPEIGAPNGMYQTREGTYGYSDDGTCFRIENESIVGSDLIIDMSKMVASAEYPDFTIVASANDGLYRCKENSITEIKGDLAKFCSDHSVVSMSITSDSTLAIASRSGGFVIANIFDDRIIHRANYGTGFPDNEVYCTGYDRNEGLWVSYDAHLIRVELLKPITTLTGFPGLDGKILAISTHNEKLYVGTSTGLFLLTATKDQAEIDRIKELESTQSIGPDLNFTPNLKRSSRNSSGPSKSGLGMSILPPGANIPGMAPVKRPVYQNENQINRTGKKQPKLEERTIFKKVTGIDVKCRKLIAGHGQLFAVCNDGLYEVTSKASRISDKTYILDAFSYDENTVIYSTSSAVVRLSRSANKWRSMRIDQLEGVTAYSVYMDDKAIWLGSENSVIKYEGGSNIQSINVRSSGNDRISIISAFGKPHFLSSSGIKHYLPSSDTTLTASIPGVENANRYRYLLSSNGSAIVKDNIGWKSFGGTDISAKLPFTSLFDAITGFSVDESGVLYLIEDGSQIHRIGELSTNLPVSELKVSIRNVTTNGDRSEQNGKLILESNVQSITFDLSAPTYSRDRSTEFQYKIDGLKSGWSPWTSSPLVELPFVTPGDYQLQVRARDILDEVSGITHVSFSVKRPIWTTKYMFTVYSLALLLLVWLIIKWRTKSLQEGQRELENLVKNRTADLEEQKGKVEEMLLNILPKETAEELQLKGRATPKQYNSASVLFTDFKDFTKITSKASAEELVSELDRYFITFDRICDKYGLEKIKTIGDSYMCACGIPKQHKDHALASVLAAIEMADYMAEVAKAKEAQGLEPWQIRIGVHSGPLMAGVVGEKKFAYDIWGDTVNIASRMESASESGRINISTATYGLVRDVVKTEARGKIQAKGKGALEMYFVNGIKPDYTKNEKPSEALLQRVSNTD